MDGRRGLGAIAVHIFTALGAGLGLLALEAVLAGDLARAFGWLGAALLVDGLDGPLARRLGVADAPGRYDGAVLDLVVDFTTYVFVPATMLLRPEVMPQPLGPICAVGICWASALYFADTRMKTEDLWFRGFPAIWNLAVFYVVAFAVPGWLAAVLIALGVALMFAPVRFVHPVRVARWRWLTLGVSAIWLVAAALAISAGMRPGSPVLAALGLCALYFGALTALHRPR